MGPGFKIAGFKSRVRVNVGALIYRSVMPTFLSKLIEQFGPEYVENSDAASMEREKIRLAMLHMKLSISDGLPAWVLPNLAIGSAGIAYNKTTLLASGITHIITVCGPSCKLAYPDDFTYRRIAFEDRAEDAEAFNAVIDEFLEYMSSILSLEGPRASRLLVHCAQGKSRSFAVISAYLCLKLRMTIDEAASRVRLVRPQVEMNPAFWMVLNKRIRSQEGKETCS